MKTAKAAGYFIKCIFVLTTDPKINIARVHARVKNGGHDVDPVKIEERYYKSLKNIKILLDICDIMHVYDNSNTPVRIIRKHKDDLDFFPNDEWTLNRIINLLNE